MLDTEFFDETNRVRMTDLMPVDADRPTLIRQLTGVRGTMRLRCELSLRFDYGLVQPRIHRDADALIAVVGPDLIVLRGPTAINPTEDGMLAGEVEVTEGQVVTFVLSHGELYRPPPAAIDAAKALQATIAYWTDWAAQFTRETPWRDAVMRSLLTLKALTYRETGGLVAALTTSLPEMPGGDLELGLSLLLAARRDIHRRRAAQRGLSSGGRTVARLDAARHRGRTRQDADHVPPGRRPALG